MGRLTILSVTLLMLVSREGIGAGHPAAAGHDQPVGPARRGDVPEPGVRDQIEEDFSKDLGPVISQFGWQFEKRFMSSDTGATAVTEWVLLFGGVDQGVVNAEPHLAARHADGGRH